MNLEDKQLILGFIKRHKIAILSTTGGNNQPEAAAIEFGETEELEIIFDTLAPYRKYKNLQNNKMVALVVGWDNDITVQYEGNAMELAGQEKEKYQQMYFAKNPETKRWSQNPEIRYFKVTPTWIRYSDLSVKPWKIIELKFEKPVPKHARKDFQKWHSLKSEIENNHLAPLFGQQEVWWCSLGSNVGVESDGKNDLFERPILIYRKFNKEMFWGLPMTSKKKEGKFYFTFPLHKTERTVMLSQMRILSAKRLIRRLGKISDSLFIQLTATVGELIKTAPFREPRVPNGN